MTEEKNSKSESKEQQPKKDWKLNNEQYNRLIECSNKGPEGIDKWNRWRRENVGEEIWLQKADLRGANLQGAALYFADLQDAELEGANLQGADLLGANLQRAKLSGANLQGAKLSGANLRGSYLFEADLQGAQLMGDLQGAYLLDANLQGADLFEADLQGANLGGARLQGAKFVGAIVNGSTSFMACKIDKDTDFRHTGLENVCISSGRKYLLKHNIRRTNWKHWYAEHRFLQWPVKLFWSISNYGISTLRIILWFFVLALFFAAIYNNCAYWWPPGVVSNLAVEPHFPLWHYLLLILVRPVYFSIVTMTTLGFGDMFAYDESVLGHILLTLQVILGYVLLGALVARLAVLFTADGPAGNYTPMDKETKELLAKLKEDKG